LNFNNNELDIEDNIIMVDIIGLLINSKHDDWSKHDISHYCRGKFNQRLRDKNRFIFEEHWYTIFNHLFNDIS